MKRLAFIVLGMALASSVNAARLPGVRGTVPAFEADSPDTCAASTVAQAGPLTLRRQVTGAVSWTDSLTSQAPGAAFSFPDRSGLPRGIYAVAVDVHDSAGNWSCPASLSIAARGRPSKIADLRIGWLELAREQRERWLAGGL